MRRGSPRLCDVGLHLFCPVNKPPINESHDKLFLGMLISINRTQTDVKQQTQNSLTCRQILLLVATFSRTIVCRKQPIFNCFRPNLAAL